MGSQDTEEIYARGTVYLPHVADWDWLTVKDSQIAHVIDWANWHNERIHAAIRERRAQDARENANQDQRHYYQVDHLGTPLELFDTDGNTVWSAKYRAWGGVLEFEVEQVKQPLRFQGQYADDETGLHYNQHRYYDPETARFVTQDPIGLVGGENLYQYGPNPVGWLDPLGLAAEGAIGGHGAIKGGGNQAHEFVRHKALVKMGCTSETQRHPDNPSIAVSQNRHTGANNPTAIHKNESALAAENLGLPSRNQFEFGANGMPSKRQMDVWQGSIRLSGISASRAKQLRAQAEAFLKEHCKCKC